MDNKPATLILIALLCSTYMVCSSIVQSISDCDASCLFTGIIASLFLWLSIANAHAATVRTIPAMCSCNNSFGYKDKLVSKSLMDSVTGKYIINEMHLGDMNHKDNSQLLHRSGIIGFMERPVL